MSHSWTSPHRPHSNKAEPSTRATHNLLSRNLFKHSSVTHPLKNLLVIILIILHGSFLRVGQDLISLFTGRDRDSNVKRGDFCKLLQSPLKCVHAIAYTTPETDFVIFQRCEHLASPTAVYVLTGGALLCSNRSIYIIS